MNFKTGDKIWLKIKEPHQTHFSISFLKFMGTGIKPIPDLVYEMRMTLERIRNLNREE